MPSRPDFLWVCKRVANIAYPVTIRTLGANPARPAFYMIIKKIRIVRKNRLFVPEQFVRYRYSNAWRGFCSPNLKFPNKDLASKFLELVELGLKTNSRPSSLHEIVFEKTLEKNENEL